MNTMLRPFAVMFLLLVVVCVADARREYFREANITVNGVELHVLVADTPGLRRKGFLEFTPETFSADGILFVFPEQGSHTFHTMGMSMPIHIMTLRLDGGHGYMVSSATHAPVGGQFRLPPTQWVLEVTEPVFENVLEPVLGEPVAR